MTNSTGIHLGSKLDPSTLDTLADFICGDHKYPKYRTGSDLSRFFQNIGINISHDGSTRKWWTLEMLKQFQPQDIEKVILRLVDLREYRGDQSILGTAVNEMNKILLIENLKISFEGIQPILKRPAKPLGINLENLNHGNSSSEDTFLKKQFNDKIIISSLVRDTIIGNILQSRIEEILACPRDKTPLGTIFLLGSTLEGLLLAIATQNSIIFLASKLSPKDKFGKTKQLPDWKLAQLIDVAHDINLIGLDVKKFSHVLRDFRNYIHPYQQMSQNFYPDQHTVDICWQVFKATINDLDLYSK